MCAWNSGVEEEGCTEECRRRCRSRLCKKQRPRNARSKRKLELAQKRDAALKGKRTRSGKLSVRKAYRDAFEKAVRCRGDYALGYQPPESVDCMFVRACVLTLEKDDPAALLDDRYMVGSFNPWRQKPTQGNGQVGGVVRLCKERGDVEYSSSISTEN